MVDCRWSYCWNKVTDMTLAVQRFGVFLLIVFVKWQNMGKTLEEMFTGNKTRKYHLL